MKFTFLVIPLLLTILFACSTGALKEIDWDKRLNTEVAPFVVEHFELTSKPDSAIVIYFNREIEEKEDAFLSIHTIVGSTHFVARPRIPIQTINGKFVLKLPIGDSLSHREEWNDGLTNDGSMMNLFRSCWNAPNEIEQIDFSSTAETISHKYRFLNGRLNINHRTLLKFSDSIINLPKDEVGWNDPWRMVLLKKYRGSFDLKHWKQGDWSWYYFNGQSLATGKFRNDTLVDRLFIYNYHGVCMDTVEVTNSID